MYKYYLSLKNTKENELIEVFKNKIKNLIVENKIFFTINAATHLDLLQRLIEGDYTTKLYTTFDDVNKHLSQCIPEDNGEYWLGDNYSVFTISFSESKRINFIIENSKNPSTKDITCSSIQIFERYVSIDSDGEVIADYEDDNLNTFPLFSLQNAFNTCEINYPNFNDLAKLLFDAKSELNKAREEELLRTSLGEEGVASIDISDDTATLTFSKGLELDITLKDLEYAVLKKERAK